MPTCTVRASYTGNYADEIADCIGYEVFMAKAQDYDTGGYQKTWSKIMAIRHALTKYPDATFIWYLDQDAFIMEPKRTLAEVVTEPRTLESLMIRNFPVVPPDSIIKTFKYLKGDDAALLISQDNDGLVSDSMVLRNGDWAKFLTETWLDPLYRTYNFQKAERHALVSDATPSTLVFYLEHWGGWEDQATLRVLMT